MCRFLYNDFYFNDRFLLVNSLELALRYIYIMAFTVLRHTRIPLGIVLLQEASDLATTNTTVNLFAAMCSRCPSLMTITPPHSTCILQETSSDKHPFVLENP